MPERKVPLVINEIYHVFNRGIDRRQTFIDIKDYQRALETVSYYRVIDLPYSLSRLYRFETLKRRQILDSISFHKSSVDVICYCLMPNHFHLLLRQLVDGGISKYLGDFQNSYTRYFNTRHERDGQLFNYQFKAVRIESESELVHVSRYVHLNPYSSSVIGTLDNLRGYPWSSLNDYMQGEQSGFVDKKTVLSLFKGCGYDSFVFDQADYQKNLKKIEHLLLDNLGGCPNG